MYMYMCVYVYIYIYIYIYVFVYTHMYECPAKPPRAEGSVQMRMGLFGFVIGAGPYGRPPPPRAML